MMGDLEFENKQSLINSAVERGIWLPDDAPEELKRAKGGRHQYRELLEQLVEAALEDGMPLRDAVPHAANVAYEIRLGATAWDEDNRRQLNFWRHIDDAPHRIRKKDFPKLYRANVESAAAAYLKSPIRAQQADRLLVDLLVAVELFAYAQHVTYTWDMMPQRRHPLVEYLLGQIKSGLFFGSIIGLFIWMRSSGFMSETVTFWLVIASAALFTLFLVIATIALPFVWWARAQGKGRATPWQIISMMAILYGDLQSEGLISAPYIREKAKKADEQGVAWPPTLFALLDDIVSRTGRF